MSFASLPRRSVLAGAAAAPLLGLPEWALAQQSKTIHVARGGFDSLDPARQFDSGSHQIVMMCYGTLLTYSYLERPYKLVPDLLERMPELGADNVTYTCRLRKGVHFHDNACFPGGKGRELTADDVLYSIKRWADAKVNVKSWFAMEGAVVGLDAHREATTKGSVDHRNAPVAGLRRLDSHTFTITLTRHNPLFLFALAMGATAPVPHEAVAAYGDQFGVNPVGTGPFTLKDVERKGVLRLLRNPRYHGTYPDTGAPGDAERGLLAAAGRKLPLVDVVEMPFIEEAQPSMLKLLKGELDWGGLDRANFTKMVRRLPEGGFKLDDEFASRLNIYWVPGVNSNYVVLNMKDPLVGGNKRLRQALLHLTDTQGAIDLLANGRGVKLKSLVPLEFPGNERDTGATYPGYDLAKGKQLLAEAGYPGGTGLPPLLMRVAGTSADARTAFDFRKAKLAAAGVQLRGEFADVGTTMKMAEAGNFQLVDFGGWSADYPDAENFYQLLYSKNVAPGPNLGSFTNAAYDKAYETSRHMANGAQRYEQFRLMNEIIKEEVPVVIEQTSLRVGIAHKWVRNFKRNLMAWEYAFIDIDMAAKNKRG